jgi:hypothetical protein
LAHTNVQRAPRLAVFDCRYEQSVGLGRKTRFVALINIIEHDPPGVGSLAMQAPDDDQLAVCVGGGGTAGNKAGMILIEELCGSMDGCSIWQPFDEPLPDRLISRLRLRAHG